MTDKIIYNIEKIIREFIGGFYMEEGEKENPMLIGKDNKGRKIEIYNEFSLQHELGIHLRNEFPAVCKIQFERNSHGHFGIEKIYLKAKKGEKCIDVKKRKKGFKKDEILKEEIDISIFNDKELLATIELKFLKYSSGEYPEQMFNICKDIAFMEHTKNNKCNKFKFAYVLVIATTEGFYKTQNVTRKKVKVDETSPYFFFRENSKKLKTIEGCIEKPTGKKKRYIPINGKYDIEWERIKCSGECENSGECKKNPKNCKSKGRFALISIK